jgi:signal transduction histidine kinase
MLLKSVTKLNVLLLIFFMIVVITVTTTAVQLAATQSTKQLEHATGAELISMADEVARLLDREMFERMKDIEVAAGSVIFTDPQFSEQQRRDAIDRLKQANDHYAWLGFVSAEGIIEIGTDQLLEGKNIVGRDWFVGGSEGLYAGDLHAAVLLEPYLGETSAGLPLRLVDVAAPVKDGQGRLVGVLGAHLDWRLAHEAANTMASSMEEDRQVDILVLSKDGVVVSGPKDLMFTKLSNLNEIVAGTGEYEHSTGVWADNKAYLTGYGVTKGYKAFAGLGWVVLVRRSAETAFAPVMSLKMTIIAIGSLIGLFFLVIAWWMARWLSQPLEKITGAAVLALSEESAITLPDSHRYVEIEKLSMALNKLLDKLNQREQDVRDANDQLEHKVEERTAELRDAHRTLAMQNNELLETAKLREDVERITKHDLKNPLNAIVSVPGLLIQDNDISEANKVLLRLVQESGYRMLEMINESLNLYKMEIGKYDYQPVNFDLSQVLQNIAGDLNNLITGKNIKLSLPTGPLMISGEPLLCHSLFSNLIKNSIEASPKAGEVTVSTSCDSDENKQYIRIHNMGVVPDDIKDKFFSKYVTSGKNEGTGLGTYSARLLTNTQCGEISMASTAEHGTTITVGLMMAVISV